MNKCANCNGVKLSPSVYSSSPRDGVTLPAMLCHDCGCLELDEGRADEIAATLGAEELRWLRGSVLRDRVWQLIVEKKSAARKTDADEENEQHHHEPTDIGPTTPTVPYRNTPSPLVIINV